MSAVQKVLMLVAILGLVNITVRFVPWYQVGNMCANLSCSEPRPESVNVIYLEGYNHSLHGDIWPRWITQARCGKHTGCCNSTYVCTATHRQTLILEFKKKPSGESVNITTTEHTRCGCTKV